MIAPTVLDRLFEPLAELSPAAAKEIAELKIDLSLQQRLDELAQRANRGELDESERNEYEQYVEGLDVLAIVKAKARAALRRSSP